MKTKLFLGMLTAAATLAVAPAVFADSTVTVNEEFTIEYQRGQLSGGAFTGTSYTTDSTVGDYSLTLPEGNVYFTGEGELTITSITSSGGETSTTDSFIVEDTTVTISGVTADLGLNLSIGTMESATLVITGGSNISTGAYLNTVGSTMATGTITIEENSTLSTQQITLGGGVSSLFGVNGTTEGAYWVQYLISDEERAAVITALTTGYQKEAKVSYGIVNVNSGSTWNVGVGNTDSSTNKLQVSNGEINISGEGSQLFMSDGSGLLLQGESGFATDDGKSYVTGVNFSQSITVTDGGSVSTSESGDGMFELVLGNSWYASNSTTDVLVSGEDSSFDVTVKAEYNSKYVGVYIGTNSGTWTADGTTQIYDGGTVDVNITAEKGGVFKVSTYGGIYVAADNYYDYLTSSTADNSGHSHGLTVAFTAESGGSLTLEAERYNLTETMDGVIYLGIGSATDDYKNTITATATGTDSQLMFSAYTIYTNYQSGNLATSFVATDSGSLTIQAKRQIVFGFETSGSNNSVEVKADGGTILITGADDVYSNYGSGDLTSEFGAYNGGTLTIEASTEVAFGFAGTDPQRKDVYLYTDGGSITVTAEGKSEDGGTASSVVISTGRVFINDNTTGDFASSFNAKDGGSISIAATSSSIYIGYTPDSDTTIAANGTSSFKATGADSTISISAKTEVLVNYNASSEFLASFAAEEGGTIYIQTTDTTNGRIYLGDSELRDTAGGKISISADGTGSTVGIYAPVEVYVNWNTSGSDFVASDGGSISITASTISPNKGNTGTSNTNVWLGYGEESTGKLNVTATGKDDDGNASSIEIASGTQIVVSHGTGENFTSNFTAEAGGSLSMSSSYIYLGDDATGGELNVSATGANSVVDISATSQITANYSGTKGGAGDIAVSFSATNGGTLKLSSQLMYFYSGTKIVANNGTVEISGTEGTGYIQLFKGASISAKNNSTLTTSDIGLFSGASVTIDGTSTWTGGWTDLYAGSSVSITTSASAITLLDDAASANVNLGEVYIENGASITVVIDISSLDNYTSASVAVLTAESIIFDYVADTQSGTTLGAGTTTADSNYSGTLASFISGYVICEQNGFDLNYWSYMANGDGTYTLYANISTMPEPSMFGMLFGLSALGLVSTRRRRRKA